jgi:hypothetical protein
VVYEQVRDSVCTNAKQQGERRRSFCQVKGGFDPNGHLACVHASGQVTLIDGDEVEAT